MTAIGAFGSGSAGTGRRSVDDCGVRDRPAPTRAAGLLLLLTPVIWGATFPAAKVALRDVSPWTFVAWSRGLGLLAIVVVLTIRRPPRVAWTRGLVPAGALLGGLMTAGYLLQTVGINHTSSTNAAFITVLYVVLAPAGAALIGRHSPDRVDVACLTLALVGLGLLSIRDGTLRAGDLLVLAGAAAFAGHIVAVDVLVDRYAAAPLALAQMAASAVLTAAIAVPAGPQAGEVGVALVDLHPHGRPRFGHRVLGAGDGAAVDEPGASVDPPRVGGARGGARRCNLAGRAALGAGVAGRSGGSHGHRDLRASPPPNEDSPRGLKPWGLSPDKGTYPRSSTCILRAFRRASQ